MNNKVILGAIIVLSVALIAILIVVCVGLDEYREPIFSPHSSMDETVISGTAEEVIPENSSNPGDESSESESESRPESQSQSQSQSSKPAPPPFDPSENSNGGGILPPHSSGSSVPPNSGSSSSGSSSGGNTENEDGKMTYEKYLSLSPAEQQEYMNSFATMDAYLAWLAAAQAEYEASRNENAVEGELDIGDYINP